MLARRPLRGLRGGRPFERPGDQLDEPIVGGFARGARTRLVGQPFKTAHPKSFTPFTNAVARHVQPFGDRAIGQALRTRQDQARPQRQPLRGFRSAHPLVQYSPFVVSQQQRFMVALSAHGTQGTRADDEVQDFF